MILDKHPFPEDPIPTEAPPSYHAPSAAPPSSYPLDEKVNPYLEQRSPPAPQSPEASSSTNPASVPLSPTGRWKGSRPWFPFGQAARTANEVRTTVLGLVRDLVKLESPASTAILQSCSEACKAHGISLSSILQEKSIEGHTALYWVIVKRLPESPSPDDSDALTGMLALAEPLSTATISDIRLACLVSSHQDLFQQLRRSPAFAPLSGPDEMLLEASVTPDEVIVEDVPGDEGAFAVHFRLLKFQARMRVSKEVSIEYIARGRIWRLSFLVNDTRTRRGNKTVEQGAWLISMSLLEHSPPTWIDSLLIIEDSRNPSNSPFNRSSSPSSKQPTSPKSARGRNKSKPTISLRLKCGAEQLASPSPYSHTPNELVYVINESVMGDSLQYDGSSYILPDGTLEGRLEAKLIKPEVDCIIC